MYIVHGDARNLLTDACSYRTGAVQYNLNIRYCPRTFEFELKLPIVTYGFEHKLRRSVGKVKRMHLMYHATNTHTSKNYPGEARCWRDASVKVHCPSICTDPRFQRNVWNVGFSNLVDDQML